MAHEGSVYRYDGTCWTQIGSFLRHLNGIFGTAADDVYVVGTWTVAHFNGTDWEEVPGFPDGVEYTAVGGSGPDDIYITGYLTIDRWDSMRFAGQGISAASPRSGPAPKFPIGNFCPDRLVLRAGRE